MGALLDEDGKAWQVAADAVRSQQMPKQEPNKLNCQTNTAMRTERMRLTLPCADIAEHRRLVTVVPSSSSWRPALQHAVWITRAIQSPEERFDSLPQPCKNKGEAWTPETTSPSQSPRLLALCGNLPQLRCRRLSSMCTPDKQRKYDDVKDQPCLLPLNEKEHKSCSLA